MPRGLIKVGGVKRAHRYQAGKLLLDHSTLDMANNTFPITRHHSVARDLPVPEVDADSNKEDVVPALCLRNYSWRCCR